MKITDDQMFDFQAALYNHLRLHQLWVEQERGILRIGRGYDDVLEIGDIDGIVADFIRLKTPIDLVARAVAALALDKLKIRHDLGGHGLTIAICAPREETFGEMNRRRMRRQRRIFG